MNKIWQPQLRVYHKSFSEVCVAGDVQFKRASVDEVPVHDDAHATIVSWWHNADQQNASLTVMQRHVRLTRALAKTGERFPFGAHHTAIGSLSSNIVPHTGRKAVASKSFVGST